MQKEISKLLKRINVEKLKNNHKECIELYNEIAGIYSDIGSYDEAVHYHEQALESCKTIGDRLGTAVAFRYIGEAKASLGLFDEAIEQIKKYLELSKRINNKVELQRAHTTLGRVYLMQAQELKDNNHVIDDNIKDISMKAEERFKTALTLAESIKDQVAPEEFSQMKIRLLINIGLVKDICGHNAEHDINEAIRLCGKTAKLKEDLYRCQIILAGMYRQKNNIRMASKTSEDALNTAKSIGKKLLICDALIERGFVKLCQRDFKNAKRVFVQAYLEKSPNEDDHAKAIRLTKLTHLISVAFDELTSNRVSSEKRLRLCDKLGDLFVAINLYKLASEYYRQAYLEAKLCSKPTSEMARILYSRAETFADDGQFEQALLCFTKELELREKIGNQTDQCQTMIKIAHMHEYLNHNHDQVCQAYDRALNKAGEDPKLRYNVLQYYVPYLENKSLNRSRFNKLQDELSRLKSLPDIQENIEGEGIEELEELEDEIANIDDIITDDEDNDEVLMVRGKRKLKAGSKKFKPNEVGDTPLHDACIKGDYKRVKSLISQGHEINPVDNAGWTPLHEACNHGHYQIVEYLVEIGADVSNRGFKGVSPLHDAASNGHFDIMRLLIKNGANVIALTDTGETVLGCLRDYKKRSFSHMSNSDHSEYRQMESELLNIMDKSGFDLMAESKRNLGTRNGKANTSADAFEEVRPADRPRERLNIFESNAPTSDSVKDYRDTIGHLKRKRIYDDERDRETSKRSANLPATFQTVTNTSASTKDWLIDDVSREKRVLANRGAKLTEFSLDEFDEDMNEDWSDDEEPIKVSRNITRNKRNIFDEEELEVIEEDQSEIEHRQDTINKDKRDIIEIDDDIEGCSQSDVFSEETFPARIETSNSNEISNPNSIEESYLDHCERLSVKVPTFMKIEMRLIDSSCNKLDLSYSSFPTNHIRPVLAALNKRNFINVDLTGVVCFFDKRSDFVGSGWEWLDTISSWRRLTQLCLKCVGLKRNHFESICTKAKLPELQILDISFNAIVYKGKEDFKEYVEILLKRSPKLKRLDVRKNHLQFVKSNYQETATGCVSAAKTCSSHSSMDLSEMLGLRQQVKSGTAAAAALAAAGKSTQDFEILGADQCDYSVYSA